MNSELIDNSKKMYFRNENDNENENDNDNENDNNEDNPNNDKSFDENHNDTLSISSWMHVHD